MRMLTSVQTLARTLGMVNATMGARGQTTMSVTTELTAPVVCHGNADCPPLPMSVEVRHRADHAQSQATEQAFKDLADLAWDILRALPDGVAMLPSGLGVFDAHHFQPRLAR
jgi:hypothetical protein